MSFCSGIHFTDEAFDVVRAYLGPRHVIAIHDDNPAPGVSLRAALSLGNDEVHLGREYTPRCYRMTWRRSIYAIDIEKPLANHSKSIILLFTSTTINSGRSP